jgi:hypothetical protein
MPTTALVIGSIAPGIFVMLPIPAGDLGLGIAPIGLTVVAGVRLLKP